MEAALGVYRTRHPENTPFYRCLEDYREEFQRGYEVLFERTYGPLRSAVTRAVEGFLRCGILNFGFARLKCQGCGRNRFLAYSCRTRQFCPSCAAKRSAAFTAWVASEVLEPVSHRQVVFTIPEVLRMLVDERCLSPEFAARLWARRHSGFQVYRAESVEPDDQPALERLCAYIGRAVFASSRVEYDPSSGGVHYRTAKGAEISLDALEWIALVTPNMFLNRENTRDTTSATTPTPPAASAANWPPEGAADLPAADADSETDHCESEDFHRECRRSWARLIQKVYEVDPLVCPDCGGRFEVIAFIDAPQTIRKILEHLHLWDLPARPPPAPLLQGKINALPARSTGNRPGPAEHADGVFVDDVPVYAGSTY